MTTMSPAPVRASGSPGTTPEPGQIAPPPKQRRRPALVAVGVACVAVGGMASAFAWQATSNAQEVLTVRETIHRGEVIGEDDLLSVRVGVDPAIRPVLAADLDTIVGKHAALDIAVGGVLTAEQVTGALVPPEGQSVVGVSLTSTQLPSNQLRVGDRVRVVTTADAAGAAATSTPEAVAALVVMSSLDEISGNTLVNVQVPSEAAPAIAAKAAAGSVALVLDSQEQ